MIRRNQRLDSFVMATLLKFHVKKSERTLQANDVKGREHQNEATCAAWLAGWSEAGLEKPKGWTKAEHKLFEPSPARVRELVPLVQEVPRN